MMMMMMMMMMIRARPSAGCAKYSTAQILARHCGAARGSAGCLARLKLRHAEFAGVILKHPIRKEKNIKLRRKK